MCKTIETKVIIGSKIMEVKDKLLRKGYDSKIASYAQNCASCIQLLEGKATEENISYTLARHNGYDIGEQLKSFNAGLFFSDFVFTPRIRTGLRVLEEEGFVEFDKGHYVFTNKTRKISKSYGKFDFSSIREWRK